MKEIKNQSHWLDIFDDSIDKTIILFKHSNTCPISRNAFEKISNGLKENNSNQEIYLLIVQDHPDLKIEIAEDLNVQHESPQIVVIKQKKPVLVLNHGDINWQKITSF